MLGAVLGTREMVESEAHWSFPPESIIQFSSSVRHALISRTLFLPLTLAQHSLQNMLGCTFLQLYVFNLSSLY